MSEEIVRQLRLVKQRVNEGSKAFRDQIDYNVLPLIKNNTTATRLVKESRGIWTAADRKAKQKIDEALKLYEQQPPPNRLPDELTVNGLNNRYGHPIIIAPVFIPRAGIDHTIDEDYINRKHLDRMLVLPFGNADRFFALGGWEPHTLKWIHRPYMQSGGKFDLTKINPTWFDTLKRRIGARADRQITTILTLTDNCSAHTNRPGFWNAHPWNGNNNVNGTSNWKPSIYHFYEEQHQDKPGIKETAKFIETYVRFLVRSFDSEFKPFLIWEICNEGQAGYYYHKLIRDILHDEGVKDNWRVMTSLDHPEFYRKDMHKFLNYSIHAINTYDKYKDAKELVNSGVRFLPSEDCLEPVPAWQYTETVIKMLEDGALGFESNERPYWHEDDYNPDLWDWHRMKLISDAWREWLG